MHAHAARFALRTCNVPSLSGSKEVVSRGARLPDPGSAAGRIKHSDSRVLICPTMAPGLWPQRRVKQVLRHISSLPPLASTRWCYHCLPYACVNLVEGKGPWGRKSSSIGLPHHGVRSCSSRTLPLQAITAFPALSMCTQAPPCPIPPQEPWALDTRTEQPRQQLQVSQALFIAKI